MTRDKALSQLKQDMDSAREREDFDTLAKLHSVLVVYFTSPSPTYDTWTMTVTGQPEDSGCGRAVDGYTYYPFSTSTTTAPEK